MTELHICLAYVTVWAMYQLWCLNRWIGFNPFATPKEETTAETAGTTLESILHFMSGRMVAILITIAMGCTGAVDVIGILVVKAFVREPLWIHYGLVVLACVAVVLSIRTSMVVYRVIGRSAEQEHPDVFFVRYENLFGRPRLEKIVVRVLHVIYTVLSIYGIVILSQILGII